jgi:hypothetical protein
MSKAIADLQKISSAGTRGAQIICSISEAANRLLPYGSELKRIDFQSVSDLANKSSSTTPLSRLLRAMATENKRSDRSFETIANEIAQRACGRPTFQFEPPPKDPWNGKQPLQYRGVQFLWYSIFLLKFLMDPFRPTSRDIEQARAKLAVRPDPPVVRKTGAGHGKSARVSQSLGTGDRA